MTWYPPPAQLDAAVHFRLPDSFRAPRRTEWSDANRHGAPVDCFLEGPAFDRDGALWFTDIPFGRIFRLAPGGACELVVQYDGWPNGLKHQGERLVIADYRNGLLALDKRTRTLAPVLRTRHSEAFKGINDLHFGADGALYFTDQGQTGIHDPSGRVYRLDASGTLDRLLDNAPSPNGLCLAPDGRTLYVAVTRGNAIWRVPLMADGWPSKAGIFIQMSGGIGPDGIAADAEGGLAVCHLGIGVWRYDPLGRPTHHLDAAARMTTNVAFGPDGCAYVTESLTGTILRVRMPAAGAKLALV